MCVDSASVHVKRCQSEPIVSLGNGKFFAYAGRQGDLLTSIFISRVVFNDN